MKKFKILIVSLFAMLLSIELLAQTIDLVQDLKNYLNQYFLSAGAFSVAVMTVTGMLKSKIKIPTQYLSIVVGFVVGTLGYVLNLGIFNEATVWQAILIVMTATLGTNGLFDLIFRSKALRSGGGNPNNDKEGG